ncbi:hypothetical protein Tco_1538447 [Tanacetum coccineum]
MKIEESLNVTFDETPPPSKTSPLVDDDLDEEEITKVTEKKNLEKDIENETLKIDEVVNIKESRNHPLENVIGNFNHITFRGKKDKTIQGVKYMVAELYIIHEPSLVNSIKGMTRRIEESTRKCWDLYLRYSQRKHKGVTSRIATLAIRVRQSNPTVCEMDPMIEEMIKGQD